MHNPLDIAEFVEAVELAEAAIARDARERVGLAARRMTERRPLEGIRHTVSRPTVPEVMDKPMPSEPLDPPGPPWPCVDGRLHPTSCGPLHSPRPVSESRWQDNISSSVMLAQPSVVKPWPDQKTAIPITCVHRDTH